MGGGHNPEYGPRVISLYKVHNRNAYLELLQLEYDKLILEQEVANQRLFDLESDFYGLEHVQKDP